MCKFYQGGEDKALELRLRSLFAKVHREKPESSRSVSQKKTFVYQVFAASPSRIVSRSPGWILGAALFTRTHAD